MPATATPARSSPGSASASSASSASRPSRSTKLNKAIETLERLVARCRRGHAKDVTGSIAAPPAAGGPPSPARVEGWVVRDVHRGTA